MRLIDADELRVALGITGTKESCKGCKYYKPFGFACNTDEAPSFAYVCEVIDEAPTVDAVPVRRGKWIHKWSGDGSVWLEQRCSECGMVIEEEPTDYNYCPNCGADMREVDG